MKGSNIFNYFSDKKKERTNNNLLNVKEREDLQQRLTTLQNEIGVSFETKVIAVTSINDDELSARFAKGFADAYALNGASTLIIDANLYNPSLSVVLGKGENKNAEQYELDKSVSCYCFQKEVYPSAYIKEGNVHKIINEKKEQFDHVIILLPSVKKHKEIVLFKDVLNAVVLLTERNKTRKQDIYEASCYFKQEELPLAKVVLLK